MDPFLSVLSTKKLTLKQNELLEFFFVDEIVFFEIEFCSEELNIEEPISGIFTSKNAVNSIFKQNMVKPSYFTKVFCVGSKTSALLKSYGLDVSIVAFDALSLAKEIKRDTPSVPLYFFCGDHHRVELPKYFNVHKIPFKKKVVYKTILLPCLLKKNYDFILFFNPLSVDSYIKGGNNLSSRVFCIGNTTANRASQYFSSVYVAREPTVESVIECLTNYIKLEYG